MDKLKKIFAWRPPVQLVALGAVIVLLLLIVPLLRIMPYCVPWYDDYNYGRFVKTFVEEERSLRSALEAAFGCAKTQWYAWQGTFSSIFLMSLVPSVWGEEFYFLGSLFLLVILTAAVMILGKVLLRDVLKADIFSSIIVQVSATATVLMLMHSAQTGLYWYNSGIHYVGMHAFLLLLVASWVKMLAGCGRIQSVLLVLFSAIGAILVSGANYVTALQGILLAFTMFGLGCVLRRKRVFLLVPSLLVIVFGFYRNVSAPGNQVRTNALMNQGIVGMQPMEAVVRSFGEAFRHAGEFTGGVTLIVMVLLAPVIWKAVKKVDFRFRYPASVLLYSFCLYATGFTPSLYSLGHGGIDRTLNAVKITYQILLFVNEVYWIGWFQRRIAQQTEICLFDVVWRRAQSQEAAEGKGSPVWVYLVAGIAMVLVFAVDANQIEHYSSYGAYCYVHSGEANEFHKEYLARVEAIKNGGDTVVVEPYHFKPWLLCPGDLTEEADNEANRAMAHWYEKDSIVVAEP